MTLNFNVNRNVLHSHEPWYCAFSSLIQARNTAILSRNLRPHRRRQDDCLGGGWGGQIVKGECSLTAVNSILNTEASIRIHLLFQHGYLDGIPTDIGGQTPDALLEGWLEGRGQMEASTTSIILFVLNSWKFANQDSVIHLPTYHPAVWGLSQQ